MTDFRPITIADLGALKAPAEPGPAPMLQWIEIKDLVVDDAYQRELTKPSLAHIGRIANGFSWAKFAPVIVAPVVGGKYAVIDGQHRATAALALGFDRVPAQVVIADQRQQAAAFAAVNGAVARVHQVVAFHARAAAGDPAAVAVMQVCAEAGVTLLRRYVTARMMRPGETVAVAAIGALIDRNGPKAAAHVLRLIKGSRGGSAGGLLSGEIIRAVGRVVEVGAPNEIAPLSPLAHLRAFGMIDLRAEHDAALPQARREKTTIGTVLVDRLNDRLDEIAAQARAHGVTAPPQPVANQRFVDVAPAILAAELDVIGKRLPPRPLATSTGSAAAQCLE